MVTVFNTIIATLDGVQKPSLRILVIFIAIIATFNAVQNSSLEMAMMLPLAFEDGVDFHLVIIC